MQTFSVLTVLALALSVAAAPAPAPGPIFRRQTLFPAPEGVTIVQAEDSCGKDMSINCCNEVVGDSTGTGGLLGLGNVLGGTSLFGQCSNLNLPIISLVNANDLLNSKCKNNAVCCKNQNQNQNGLINAGIQCIPLTSVLG